jgi:anti-sigma regulatory factor (Ser/Thr protein kinase)
VKVSAFKDNQQNPMKENIENFEYNYSLQSPLEEDVIWRKDISPHLTGTSQNIMQICQYGFTEMVNNAIEHSGSQTLKIKVSRDAKNISFVVIDEGIGIFRKIKNDLGLEEPAHAILELVKGKFTSDPQRHTGEGIFFTSRIFDTFTVASANLIFSRLGNEDQFETSTTNCRGTTIIMKISTSSRLFLSDVFNEYADPEKQPGFYKTTIPVQIIQNEGESLMSRSQAKRLMNRFDRFLEVVLDFTGVSFIGQGFADEIFRVFVRAHPGTRLIPTHCTETVEKMIAHVSGDRV